MLPQGKKEERAKLRRTFWSMMPILARSSATTSTTQLPPALRMAFGTNAGVSPYGINAKQFALMVKYGMTPMQAIQAATISAADLLGHSNEVSSVKPEKYADIIAVSDDPLATLAY
jgi:hypothetical protein